MFYLPDGSEGPDRLWGSVSEHCQLQVSSACATYAQSIGDGQRPLMGSQHHQAPKYLCAHVSTALGFDQQPTDREVFTAVTLAFPNFWELNSALFKNNKQTVHVLTIICTKPLAFQQLCCLPSRGCGNLLPAAAGYENLNYPAFKCRSQDIQFPPVKQGT